jgi:hypothetical protein
MSGGATLSESGLHIGYRFARKDYFFVGCEGYAWINAVDLTVMDQDIMYQQFEDDSERELS